jgi:hypothetical protein
MTGLFTRHKITMGVQERLQTQDLKGCCSSVVACTALLAAAASQCCMLVVPAACTTEAGSLLTLARQCCHACRSACWQSPQRQQGSIPQALCTSCLLASE